MSIASQDFRDGAATGAAQLARRLRAAESLGVPITGDLIATMAGTIRTQWGGFIYPTDETLLVADVFTPR